MLSKKIKLPKIQSSTENNLPGTMIFSQGIVSHALIMDTQQKNAKNLSYMKLKSKTILQQRKCIPRCNNYFAPLNYRVQCFKCKKFWHIPINYILKENNTQLVIEQIEQKPKIWKEMEKSEQCDIALYAHNGGSHWDVENGCSRHMLVDRRNF